MPQCVREAYPGLDCPLLALAQDLHQNASGSSDSMGPAEVRCAVELLERALREWEPSPPYTLAYDEAVRTLVRAALAEAGERLFPPEAP